MTVRPIQPGEERAAAEIFLAAWLGRPPAPDELDAWLAEAPGRGIVLSRQAVAVDEGGRIVAAAVYFGLADGTATGTMPACGADVDRETEIAVLRALRVQAADEGMTLMQVFTEEEDACALDVLCEAGFEELALMRFMERPVCESDRKLDIDKEIRWRTLETTGRETFERVVAETWQGTLDCAKLGQTRDVRSTLDGYVSEGFDPSLWFLAEVEGESAACLLITPEVSRERFELSYMGVVPRFRGKGLGRKVMQKGLKEVSLRNASGRITLAVDDANEPALSVYFGLGFEVAATRRVSFSLLATPGKPVQNMTRKS
jgi:ribosomal protein S18 acetylase RimI-like enzyme